MDSTALSYRIRAAVVLAGVIALLGVAVYLQPDRLERFNSGYPLLKPCGFLVQSGYPCPTCFMTRSFVYMMHGHPIKAFAAQPFGALLIVIYLGVGAVQVLVTGRPWQPFWSRWRFRWVLIGFAALFLGAWIFKLLFGTFVTGEFPIR